MNIALLGMGTVGSGVYELLAGREDVRVRRILDRRPLGEAEGLRTENMEDILSDPGIDTVVELLGGVQPAFRYAEAALRAGKNLVSANKLMISSNLGGLLEAAREGGGQLRVSASVGGGIPFLPNLLRARRVDEILEIGGIVNGTTNLILDTMQRQGAEFDEALAMAQAAGFAEADPSADLDGVDARCKLAIAASSAFDGLADPERIPTRGIRGMGKADVANFRRMGMVCRLLAEAERGADGVSAIVEPALVRMDAPEAGVFRNENYIALTGRRLGRLAFRGQGAGKEPTACAVVGDLLDIAGGAPPAEYTRQTRPLEMRGARTKRRYYVRAQGLPFPAEPMGGGAYCTEPVFAEEMHAFSKQNPVAFFAAIRHESS